MRDSQTKHGAIRLVVPASGRLVRDFMLACGKTGITMERAIEVCMNEFVGRNGGVSKPGPLPPMRFEFAEEHAL